MNKLVMLIGFTLMFTGCNNLKLNNKIHSECYSTGGTWIGSGNEFCEAHPPRGLHGSILKVGVRDV